MHVSDDDSNMFCKFDVIWWTLKKCWNFMILLRAGTVGIFLWKNLTSLKRLKFHMHVSDDDSNMFCKFDEMWWTLKKCWNFMILLRAGTVGIFLWKNLTSLKRLKFHMHVSDDDYNMFCKFYEIWWILKTMVKLHNIIKGRHCHHFSVKKFNFSEWAQISHACFWWWFQYVLQVWWNLVNFEKKLKFHDIIKGRHCRHFSVKKFNFSEKAQISHACFWWWFQYVLQV